MDQFAKVEGPRHTSLSKECAALTGAKMVTDQGRNLLGYLRSTCSSVASFQARVYEVVEHGFPHYFEV